MNTIPIKHPSLTYVLAFMVLLTIGCLLLIGCTYDEEVELCQVVVRLEYPENTVSPYAGARVEMKDATASVFVDSTGTEWWRYIFNGVRSLIIVSPDSANVLTLPLKMSRKRIVH